MTAPAVNVFCLGVCCSRAKRWGRVRTVRDYVRGERHKYAIPPLPERHCHPPHGSIPDESQVGTRGEVRPKAWGNNPLRHPIGPSGLAVYTSCPLQRQPAVTAGLPPSSLYQNFSAIDLLYLLLGFWKPLHANLPPPPTHLGL